MIWAVSRGCSDDSGCGKVTQVDFVVVPIFEDQETSRGIVALENGMEWNEMKYYLLLCEQWNQQSAF